MRYECDNCEARYDADNDIGDKITPTNWHMEPGAVVPYGVCGCGGYIHGVVAGAAPLLSGHVQSQGKQISEFAAGALDSLLGLFSEDQQIELLATGRVTLYPGPGRKPPKPTYLYQGSKAVETQNFRLAPECLEHVKALISLLGRPVTDTDLTANADVLIDLGAIRFWGQK